MGRSLNTNTSKTPKIFKILLRNFQFEQFDRLLNQFICIIYLQFSCYLLGIMLLYYAIDEKNKITLCSID